MGDLKQQTTEGRIPRKRGPYPNLVTMGSKFHYFICGELIVLVGLRVGVPPKIVGSGLVFKRRGGYRIGTCVTKRGRKKLHGKKKGPYKGGDWPGGFLRWTLTKDVPGRR